MARANNEASTRSLSLLQSLGGLLQNLLTLIAVVESGNHAELLAQGGLYAASWIAQMQAETSVSRGIEE